MSPQKLSVKGAYLHWAQLPTTSRTCVEAACVPPLRRLSWGLSPGPHTSLPLPTELCSRVLPAPVSQVAEVGGMAPVWPSPEKQPCTDGGAAGCTVVGPPSAGEHGCAHSEVTLTTFLSWQPCTLSSSLVQANGFAAVSLSPRVS